MSNIATLKLYLYGMKYRGFSPGCQPMEGYIDKLPEEVVKGTKYHDILLYNRALTWGEVRAYELDLIATGEKGWRGMAKVVCASLDCKYNDENNFCTRDEIVLSDHSLHTVWEGVQHLWRCKCYAESDEAKRIKELWKEYLRE